MAPAADDWDRQARGEVSGAPTPPRDISGGSGPTKERLGARSRQAMYAIGLLFVAFLVRMLFSGHNLVEAALLTGALVACTAMVLAVIFALLRRADARRREADPSALYVGRGTIYLDQIRQAPELVGSADQAKDRAIRFWSQGQGLLEGTLRLDQGHLEWKPMRLARRFKVQPWVLRLSDIASTEANRGHLPIGANGVVTLRLGSGHEIDVMVTDRHRFAEAWDEATSGSST